MMFDPEEFDEYEDGEEDFKRDAIIDAFKEQQAEEQAFLKNFSRTERLRDEKERADRISFE